MEPKITQPQITASMIRNSKLFTCDCGGATFKEGIFFKKISAFISPTGKEELYPMGIVICNTCGKVPSALNKDNMVPEELLARFDPGSAT